MPTIAEWREQQARQSEQYIKQRMYDSSKREWITIDGEGWGKDQLGRQNYRFMIAANESGFASKCVPGNGESLTTYEALSWLASLREMYRLWCERTKKDYYSPHIGGFALGYDYAHILIDITQPELELLLSSSDFDSAPIRIGVFSVKLTSGNLRIYTPDSPHIELACIWDTFKYYQAAFLKVMKAYASEQQWSLIEAGKNRRNADKDHDVTEEMLYCLAECRVHSRAMNDLQHAIHDMDLHPTGWYGPGSLAASAMRKHHTKSYWKADEDQPAELAVAARYAYVGGRFETTGHGWLSQMYGHDIRSAYPDGMTRLPCLKHGAWHHIPDSETAEYTMRFCPYTPCVGLVEWHCDSPAGGWGPYPTRSINTVEQADKKLPSWPFHGKNWIWSEEFHAGTFLCSKIIVHEAWAYERTCECQPFDWVPEYYDLRRKLREDGNEIGEKVVKLILNSGYGKIAQSIGNPPVPTWIWAGLITQSARAKLLRAISTAPDECIMVATDAVYSTAPLCLDFGSQLGEWDGPTEYGRTLVIQAGFWRDYDNDISKTRGIAKRYLEPMWPVFEDLWTHILDRPTDITAGVVPIRYSDHIGLQRARQYGVEKLGIWTDDAYQNVRFRVDKRPHLIGKPDNGWYRSSPTRTDRVGEQLTLSLGVEIGDQYISSEEASLVSKWFITEQPDAAEWGYSDD